jgi:excisionase family DNA binding protein
MEKDLLTRAEVMAWLRISKRTLDKMMRNREIPFHKVGKAVRFKRQELDKWFETTRVK